MPTHIAICDSDTPGEACGHRQEFMFHVKQGAEATASALRCDNCGRIGMRVDWRQSRLGFDMVFRPGFYQIGTATDPRLPGKYYNSLREMRNDAARHGIILERQ